MRIEGKAVCNACYQRVIYLKECGFCHQIKRVAIKKNDQAVCHSCYRKIFHLEKCTICNRVKSIVTRNIENKGAICDACYRRQKYGERLIKSFLSLSPNEVANFIVETARRRNKLAVRKLDILSQNQEVQKKLREALILIFQTAVVAKNYVIKFINETKEGKKLKELIN